MGVFNTTIRIKNATKPSDSLELPAKVDTGATLLVLPQQVADKLDLVKIRQETVKYADERTAQRDVMGVVEIDVCGRIGCFEALVEPR